MEAWLLPKQGVFRQPGRLLQASPCRPPGRPASATLLGWAVLPVMRCFPAYAELYCKIERKLFAEVSAGRSALSLKQEYLRRYRIPARMFNAIRVSLEGKVASVQGAAARSGGMTCSGALPGPRNRLPRLDQQPWRAGCIRSSGDWGTCTQSWRSWIRILSLAGYGFALVPGGCGASSMPWGPTATPITVSGSGTGRPPEVMSSSCWGAGTRRRAASLCVATVAEDGSLTLRLRVPDCLAGRAWQVPGHSWHPFQVRPRAGPGGPEEQRPVRGLPSPARGAGGSALGPGPGH